MMQSLILFMITNIFHPVIDIRLACVSRVTGLRQIMIGYLTPQEIIIAIYLDNFIKLCLDDLVFVLQLLPHSHGVYMMIFV